MIELLWISKRCFIPEHKLTLISQNLVVTAGQIGSRKYWSMSGTDCESKGESALRVRMRVMTKMRMKSLCVSVVRVSFGAKVSARKCRWIFLILSNQIIYSFNINEEKIHCRNITFRHFPFRRLTWNPFE
jgi:hypothetical protein